MPKCVTYVPGILCNLCVRKLKKGPYRTHPLQINPETSFTVAGLKGLVPGGLYPA
jgi:hypothetical protein